MANIQQMVSVGNNCLGYESKAASFEASIEENNIKSCSNCENFKNNKCVKNLFDRVLTSLDQG